MITDELASIKRRIHGYGFKRLLLAVSGGLDSICLAHYFIENREALGIEWLGIAHVHHGLREGTADRDAQFVEAFARKHGVPFFLKKLDGEALKAAEGSLEENARDARYKALMDVVSRASSLEPRASIVTAHHAGDQAETMFMRLRRGTTLAGLRGIQEVREMGREQSAVSDEEKEPPRTSSLEPRASSFVSRHSSIISLYRPFLSVTRAELLAYAREHSLEWSEDESNADVKFARNKVRHEQLPQLEKSCPGATAQLCRIARLADRAYDKAIDAAKALFEPAVVPPEKWPFEPTLAPYANVLALDAAKLESIKPYPELLRLWLNSRGFRFSIDMFAKPNPLYPCGNAAKTAFSTFRTRSIEKCRHIIWIYDTQVIAEPSNLYFSEEKQRFSGISGQWRHPHQDDMLCPTDMKIKPRKLATWLQEKSVPRWVRDSLQVFAQDSRVLFVSGIRTKIEP